MTNKEKLINLLYIVDEIKEDMDKKNIKHIIYSYHYWELFRKVFDTEEEAQKSIDNNKWNAEEKIYSIEIWNILEERHLRMFAENKWYAFAIWSTWKLIWNKNEEWSYVEIQLDNTKSFDNQSEEVWEKILNYLNW